MDVRRLIPMFRVWFPLLVASVLLAAAAAYLVSVQLPKTYEAKATLIVGQSLSAANADYNELLASQQLAATYAKVAMTRPVLERVIKQLGLSDTPDDLAQRVRADAATDTTLLTITVHDADPSSAAAIANAIAGQLIASSPAIQGGLTDLQKSIDADLQATQDRITSDQERAAGLLALPNRTTQQDAVLQALESELVTLRSTYATLLAFSSGNLSNLLSVVDPAVPPTSPVSPKVLLNVLVAALLGLLAAAAVAVIAEYLDDRVKDADAVQDVTGLGTLATIGSTTGERGRRVPGRLAALMYPRSGAAEAYRTLRTNIEFASTESPIRTLLVASSIPGEGRTVTAANLAVVFAQAGRHVLLVDADLRKPQVHLVFDLPNAHGLTTLLRSEEVGLDAVAHKAAQQNLWILTSGPLPPNPAELLGSQRMRALVEQLKSGHDIVIFDSPALLATTDSAILSTFLDGTLFVIDAGRTHRRSVLQGREALARVRANVLGAVLNRIPARRRPYYFDDVYAVEQAPGPDESRSGPLRELSRLASRIRSNDRPAGSS